MTALIDRETTSAGALQLLSIPVTETLDLAVHGADHIVAHASQATGLIRAGRVVSADRSLLVVILVWEDLEAMGNSALDLAPHLGQVSETSIDTITSVFLPVDPNELTP